MPSQDKYKYGDISLIIWLFFNAFDINVVLFAFRMKLKQDPDPEL